jgi:hypothetical protein
MSSGSAAFIGDENASAPPHWSSAWQAPTQFRANFEEQNLTAKALPKKADAPARCRPRQYHTPGATGRTPSASLVERSSARPPRVSHQRAATVPELAVGQVSIEPADGVDYLEGMSDQEIARFRAQAEECRQQAERAVSPLDKEAWLRVAGEWIKLAQETEQKRGG